MKTKKKESKVEKELKVSEGLSLILEDLFADVEISTGKKGKAKIEMSGDEKLLQDIDISEPDVDSIAKPSLNSIEIRGKEQGNSVTIRTGGGRRGITVSSIRGSGNVVISGSGGSISVGRGSKIVVNGKVVSGGDSEWDGESIPKIRITAPKGTDLDFSNVESLHSSGLGGKLRAAINGQNEASVTDVNGLRVRCSGQSKCVVRRASGNADVKTGGQSSLDIKGDLGDVAADSGGQSGIRIKGTCHDFEGEAGGQSNIIVSGTVSGEVRQRESGQGSISIR